jgi:hypothetical protein
MKKFIFTVRNIAEHEIEVEAENMEEAARIAEDRVREDAVVGLDVDRISCEIVDAWEE